MVDTLSVKNVSSFYYKNRVLAHEMKTHSSCGSHLPEYESLTAWLSRRQWHMKVGNVG